MILTATVSPSTATGTVTFKDGLTSLGTGTLSGGTATLALSTLATASHSLTAVYGGDINDGGSTSPVLTQTVNPAATTTALTSSAIPSIFGQNVVLTVTVSPSTATGTVTFKDGSTSLGTGTLSGGTATLALSTLATASHSLTAVYGGDINDGGSTSPVLTQTVNPQPVPVLSTLSVSPSPVTEGSVTTLQGTFTDDASATHTITVNWGDGTSTTINLAAGILNFSANHTYLDNGPKPQTSSSYTYSISVTVANNYGGSRSGSTSVTVNNANPVVTALTGPSSVAVNSTATFTANFTDPGVLDKHTCTFTFGDGHLLSGAVTESGGTGSCKTSYAYRAAGTYTVGVTVFDDINGSVSSFIRVV